MKKFFRFCLWALIFVGFMGVFACSQDVVDFSSKTESVGFSFRAGGDLSGAKVIVSLSKGNDVITQEKAVSNSGSSVNFSFDNIAVGENVAINAVLKKDNVELFKGGKSLTVVSGDNRVSLVLEPVSVKLSLSPKLNLSDEELLGAYFKVTVNGKELPPVKIEAGAADVSADVGYVEIGKNVNVKGQIVKTSGGKDVVLYSVEKTILAEKSGVISLDLTRENVKVLVSAKLPAKVADGSELLNAVFKVTVDGNTKEHEIALGEEAVGIDFGYFNVNSEIKNISGVIVKSFADKSVEIYKSNIVEKYTVPAVPGEKGVANVYLTLEKTSFPVAVKVNVKNPAMYLEGGEYKIFVNDVEKISKKIDLPVPSEQPKDLTFEENVNVIAGDVINVKLVKDNDTVYKCDAPVTVKNNDTQAVFELVPVTVNVKVVSSISIDKLGTNDTDNKFLVTVGGAQKDYSDLHFVGEPEAKCESVNFDVNAGEEITAAIEITNKGQKSIVFEEKYVVKSTDKEISLTMPQVRTLLKVYPDAGINLNNYIDAVFEVVVDNGTPKTATVENPVSDIGIDLGYVEIGISLAIKAELKKTTGELFYQFPEVKYTPTGNEADGKYVLTNGIRNDGYMLWQSGGSGNVNVYYGDLQNQNTTSAIMAGSKMLKMNNDFAFTPEGGVWILDSDWDQSYLYYLSHGFAGFEQYNLKGSVEGADFAGPDSYPEIKSIAICDGGLLVSANFNGSYTFYKLTKGQPNKLVSEKINITAPTSLSEMIRPEISEITVSGNNVYGTFMSIGDRGSSFRIYKGSLSGTSLTFDNAPLFDSSTYSDGSAELFKGFDFVVTDMQVVDGSLYALLFDNTRGPACSGYSSNHSRGALIEISSNGAVKVVGLHDNKLNSGAIVNDGSVEDANRIYMLNNTQTDLIGSKFLGPRKFIAIKPKKLVIADAGAIKVGTNASTDKKELKKRIITVNIEGNISFESVKECQDDMFAGGFSSGYAYSSELPF